MVWKQDLAKLKQELKASEGPTPKAAPAPKPAPKPAETRPLEDEDALFLSAMGQRSAPKPKATPLSIPAPVAPLPAPQDTGADFQAEMQTLKGLKPMGATQTRPEPAAASAPPPRPVRPPSPAPEPPRALPREEPELRPAEASRLPQRIQLAAGMAIEVDAVLDLRGHSPQDATERLKERIQDGVFLGWRSLHVQLGGSPELQEAFLALLQGPGATPIARYAQAPIPMGGTQAWILYYPAH